MEGGSDEKMRRMWLERRIVVPALLKEEHCEKQRASGTPIKELSLCHKFIFCKTYISLQPDDVNLIYFKLTLFDLTEFIV